MKTVNIQKETISFRSTGFVIGNLWGGGIGGYVAEKLHAKTREELLHIAQTMLNDGSLDAGMGYESLIGAVLDVVKSTEIIINEESFINETIETVFIGELTDEQKEFLYDCCI